MGSKSLEALTSAVGEIEHLAAAGAAPGRLPKNPSQTRVIGRASVVLLCSHFERYLHALLEELVLYLNTNSIQSDKLPAELKLLHSRPAIEEMALMQWTNRAEKLTEFVEGEAWLWSKKATSGQFSHTNLLAWMKSPKPKHLIRMFRYWAIDDVFSAITTTPHTRQDLQLRITELVDKRNNIAHGDITTEASRREVRLYSMAVIAFCQRVDRKIGIQVAKLFGLPRPW